MTKYTQIIGAFGVLVAFAATVHLMPILRKPPFHLNNLQGDEYVTSMV